MSRAIPSLFFVLLFLGPALAAEEDPPTAERTVEEYFPGGKVVRFEGRRITLEYDVEDPACLGDFKLGNPFLVPHEGGFDVVDGALSGRGVGALVHKGVFEADVTVKATVVTDTPRDIGVVLVKPGMADQFLLFALADNFFSKKDRKPVNQHMITVVGASTTDGDDGTQFRYLERTRKPTLEKGRSIEITVRKQGEKNRFAFAGTSLAAADRYGGFSEVQPGLYVLHSAMEVKSLTISGRLSERWLREVGIFFDPTEKDTGKPPDIEVPRRDTARGDARGDRPRGRQGRWGRRKDESEAMGLVDKLRDTGLPEKEREAAAAGLDRGNVKVDEFRALLDCLYSSDLLTRTLAIKALKKVSGKTLGYHPKAPEDSRKKATRKWFKYFMDNRERLR